MTRRLAGMLGCAGLLLFAPACTPGSDEQQKMEQEVAPQRAPGGPGAHHDDSQDVYRMGGAGQHPTAPTVGEMGPTAPAEMAPQTGENPYAPQRELQRGAGQNRAAPPADTGSQSQ